MTVGGGNVLYAVDVLPAILFWGGLSPKLALYQEQINGT